MKQLDGAGEDVCGASMLTGNEVVAVNRTRFGRRAVSVETVSFFVGWICTVLRCCVHKDQQYKYYVETRESLRKPEIPPVYMKQNERGQEQLKFASGSNVEGGGLEWGQERLKFASNSDRSDSLFSSRL